MARWRLGQKHQQKDQKYVSLHGVWKSQKKSHSTWRAKRATFTFWVDKSSLKMPKIVNFDEVLKTQSLRSNSVTRQVNFNWTKIGKFKWGIFRWFSNIENWWSEMACNWILPFVQSVFCNRDKVRKFFPLPLEEFSLEAGRVRVV